MPNTLSRLIRLAFLICLWLLITSTAADPDLWGHLRFGLDLLRSGVIPRHDPYSFTADRLWVNHEWLSEWLLAVAYRVGGASGLNVLKLGVIAVIAWVVVKTAREEGASDSARDGLVFLTIFATYTRTQVLRPQLFSVGLFCVILYLIRTIDRGGRRAVWALPVCFALWVNLHGAWIVGLAAVGSWICGSIAERPGWRVAVLLIVTGVLCAAATLMNPYGVSLWRFVFETVRPARADISDWKPLLALPAGVLVIEAILPTVAVIAWRKSGRPVPFRYLVVLLVLVAATFKVGRVDAFAQAAIALFLAPQILCGLTLVAARLRAPFWRRPLPFAPVAAMPLAIGFLAGAWQLREVTVEGAWIPDPPAALYLREHAARARVLTWFDWGEYAIWQLSSAGIRVSIDGRRETAYSTAIVQEHYAFYHAEPGELDYPRRIGADCIWLPVDTPAVEPLQRNGWNIVFRSARSVVLAKTPAELYRVADDFESQRRFPWP